MNHVTSVESADWFPDDALHIIKRLDPKVLWKKVPFTGSTILGRTVSTGKINTQQVVKITFMSAHLINGWIISITNIR
uniref:Uncharacterized protein n=1 Tax=Anguilla anguilla TaxID=7936 RepID=A0A0E9PFR7_ANGAN